MILWTIQHEEAYFKMMRFGVLRADVEHLFCEDDFLNAYDWMSEQMRARISEPPDGVRYPVWLWHTWEGKRKRPDMRSSGYAEKGTPIVLLTVDVPDEQVLLSDFDLWHYVMNGFYIGDAEEKDVCPFEDDIKKSWNIIFDVSANDKYAGNCVSIQATTWKLHKEWIKKAEHFIAR